jgi:hypothetical protein
MFSFVLNMKKILLISIICFSAILFSCSTTSKKPVQLIVFTNLFDTSDIGQIVASQNYSALPEKIAPTPDVFLMHQLIGLPQYLPPSFNHTFYHDTLVQKLKDSNASFENWRYLSYKYGSDSTMNFYREENRRELYEASYVFDDKKRLTFSLEREQNIEFKYNAKSWIDSILIKDKLNKPIKKYWIIYQ